MAVHSLKEWPLSMVPSQLPPVRFCCKVCSGLGSGRRAGQDHFQAGPIITASPSTRHAQGRTRPTSSPQQLTISDKKVENYNLCQPSASAGPIFQRTFVKQRRTDMIITTHAGDRFNLIDTLTNSSAWDSR